MKRYVKSYAYTHVFNSIKEAIISGALRPGDRLPSEADLCQRLGVGRAAVREGLREVERAGMIRTVRGPKGGRFVAEANSNLIVESLDLMMRITGADFDQLIEVRKINEAVAAELAALHRTEQDLEAMERALECFIRGIDSKAEFVRWNYEFHKYVALASKNTVLFLIIQALRKLIFRSFSIIELDGDGPQVAVEQHRAIYQAIKEQNAERARELMLQHIEEFHRRWHLLQSTEETGEPPV